MLMSRKELREFKKKFTDLKSFQDFITENKITSSQNFKDRFLPVYVWLRKAKLTKEVIYYGQTESVGDKEAKRLFIEEHFNTLEDFQNFIDQNSISSPKEFQKHYLIYMRLTSLGFANQVKYCREEKFSGVYEAFQIYKTPEDFQNFIIENKIVSSKDFYSRFSHIYNLFRGLGYSDEVSYFGSSKPIRNPLTATKEEINRIQSIIDEKEITSFYKLRSILGSKRFYEEVVSKGIRPPIITYFGKEKKEFIDPRDFDTLEKIQHYIDLHKIRTQKDLPSRVIFLIRAQNFTNFLNYYSENKIDLINTIDEFNQFIEMNQITGSTDFSNRFNDIYTKALVLGISSNLKYYGREEKEIFNNVEQFQTLIDLEDIKNPTDFRAKHPSLYQRLSDLGFCSLVKYHGNPNQSCLEHDVEELLISKGIEYEARKQQPFLSNHKSLDVFIKKYNLGIECQGDMHFIPVELYGGEKDLERRKENDLDKYNECKKNNITLLYYINPAYCRWGNRKEILNYHVNNYIDKVYTSIDDLWNRILEIIKENEQDSIN